MSQLSIQRLFNSTNGWCRCNKEDYFVKVIVGKTSQTFLVPAAHINFGWQHFNFTQTVRNAEITTASGDHKPSSSSSRRQSITKSLRSLKKWFFSSSETKDSNANSKDSDTGPPAREINLPDDDPVAWSAFLFWSMHPANAFPKVDISRDLYSVRTWNLGSKYGFEDFADDAMKLLIDYFEEFEPRKVNQTVTFDAIEATFCPGPSGDSVLKTLFAQEIAKSQLFHKCDFTTAKPHDASNCYHCKRDKFDVMDRLKCTLPPGKKRADHACGLEKELWAELVKAKQMYCDGNIRLFSRLAKPKGKAPVYMDFLKSPKWVQMREM